MPCGGCGDACKCTTSHCCHNCKCDASCSCPCKRAEAADPKSTKK